MNGDDDGCCRRPAAAHRSGSTTFLPPLGTAAAWAVRTATRERLARQQPRAAGTWLPPTTRSLRTKSARRRSSCSSSRKLEDSYDYSRLCERRICELHPHHPIPITEDCLGVANVAAAQLVPKSSTGGGTGRSAKLRRENAELAESNKALEKQLKSARNKLTDVSGISKSPPAK